MKQHINLIAELNYAKYGNLYHLKHLLANALIFIDSSIALVYLLTQLKYNYYSSILKISRMVVFIIWSSCIQLAHIIKTTIRLIFNIRKFDRCFISWIMSSLKVLSIDLRIKTRFTNILHTIIYTILQYT